MFFQRRVQRRFHLAFRGAFQLHTYDIYRLDGRIGGCGQPQGQARNGRQRHASGHARDFGQLREHANVSRPRHEQKTDSVHAEPATKGRPAELEKA
jgi:hypothetical protein